jgi:tRNA pseudouridine55 synthase
MYSAKKMGGRKLYELARRGEEVERKSVQVTVREFEVIQGEGPWLKVNDDATADLNARVVCSAGTYIRTLAEDLGKQLGVGAHLVELRRTRAGHFKIHDAITLERLAELSDSNLAESRIISPDAVLSHLPAIELTAEDVTHTIHGVDLRVESAVLNCEGGAAVRMRSADNKLIAVGTYDDSRKVIHPTVVIANN